MNDKELAAMRNVAGEIKGAEAAMRYAIENGFDNIAIYHDYEWGLQDGVSVIGRQIKRGQRLIKHFMTA